MVIKKPLKTQDYTCDICSFISGNKKDFNRHILTPKHLKLCHLVTNDNNFTQKNPLCICECGNIYKYNSGLSRHKKTCNKNNDEPEILSKNVNNDILQKDNLIEYLIKENSEFKGLIMELIKKESINNTIHNNVNSNNINNNSFNLNFFLNETCKDALNIGEFVDSIKIQLTDLENVGRVGYVEGVSKILIKNLNELETCKRPIHCSDSKRDVLYIKDDNKWSKENEDKLVIKKAIRDVSNKNIKQITEWTNLNPDCKKSDSRKNDQYLKIVMNSMSGGSNEEQCNNVEKIIKNITKSVIIEK